MVKIKDDDSRSIGLFLSFRKNITVIQVLQAGTRMSQTTFIAFCLRDNTHHVCGYIFHGTCDGAPWQASTLCKLRAQSHRLIGVIFGLFCFDHWVCFEVIIFCRFFLSCILCSQGPKVTGTTHTVFLVGTWTGFHHYDLEYVNLNRRWGKELSAVGRHCLWNCGNF